MPQNQKTNKPRKYGKNVDFANVMIFVIFINMMKVEMLVLIFKFLGRGSYLGKFVVVDSVT